MLIHRVIAAVAATSIVLAALSGCAAGRPGAADGAVPAVAASAEQCAALFRLPVPADAGELLVLLDGTRSRGGRTALPAAAVEAVQQASMRREAVSVLAVDGRGAAPRWLLPRSALNHADLADDVRKVVVAAGRAPSCIQQVARRAVPGAPGTDLGQAFRAISEAAPPSGRVDVLAITDGVSNSGVVDLAGRIAVRPVADVVRDLVDDDAISPLRGARVTIAGVGAVDGVVVPDASARWLRSFWTAWCEAAGARSCSVPVQDQGVAGAAAAPPRALPADRLPELPAAMRFRAAVRFSGDSAVLTRAGRRALAPVVACLVARPAATGAIRVDGFVAPTGAPLSADRDLATRRAVAVAARLRAAAHVAAARLRPHGHGPDDPLPDRSGDRRVVFVSVEGGC